MIRSSGRRGSRRRLPGGEPHAVEPSSPALVPIQRNPSRVCAIAVGAPAK